MKAWIIAAVVAVSAATAVAQQSGDDVLKDLKWLPAGQVGSIDSKAQFKATDNYTFLGVADTDKFLKFNGNPPPGNSYTIMPTKAPWFGVLHFSPEGYIKDDEKIDADKLLESLKAQNVEGSKRRREKGFETLTLEGWAIPPRYDTENKRLEWGTRLKSDRDGQTVVNVSTRILGRSGYTSAVLVTSPQTLEADLVDFKNALKNFDYVGGEKYSEWKQGDKVAAYGLGALVLGSAAAVATSKGGFKLLWLAILGGAAALWSGVKRVLGRKTA